MEENLEDKIYTCSAKDFISFTEYKKKELELVGGIQISRKASLSRPFDMSYTLYSDLGKYIQKMGYIAVIDVRLNITEIVEDQKNKCVGTIYGTGLKLKNS